MNVGIIGVSDAAQRVASAISERLGDKIYLYAIASEVENEGERFAEKWKVEKVYNKYVDMLVDENVELVFIATSNVEHYKNLKLCLMYQKRCFTEGGFCTNSSQAREIFYEAEAKKIFVSEVNKSRFLPSTKLVSELLQKGVIGNIDSLVINVSKQSEKSIGIEDYFTKDELLSLGFETLNAVAVYFGTNIISLDTDIDREEDGMVISSEIEASYYDGRVAKIVFSPSNRKNFGRIYGSKGYLEFGPISGPNYIWRYDTNNRLIEKYDICEMDDGCDTELLMMKRVIEKGLLECEEMTHTESIRIINWLDHIRSKWDILFEMEDRKDLCVYSAEGLKRYIIVPFRRYWLDCFNCVVNSLVDYAFDMPANYYYSNDYAYRYTDEITHKTNIKYKSLLPITDVSKIYVKITKENEYIKLCREENPIAVIREALNDDKIVLAAVDLFNWVDSGMHYQHTHILHYSLVVGYDDNQEELMVFETGDYGYTEFRVPYERAIMAIRSNPEPSMFSRIKREHIINPLKYKDIMSNAVNVIQSIDFMVTNIDTLWDVRDADEDEASELYNIIPSHMYSIQNRLRLNASLLHNEGSCSETMKAIVDDFNELSRNYEKIKNMTLKFRMKGYKKENINEIRIELELLLKNEKELWLEVIDEVKKQE